MFAGCENGNMYSKLLVLWDLTHCKVEGPKISLEKERNVCNFLLLIHIHKISMRTIWVHLFFKAKIYCPMNT